MTISLVCALRVMMFAQFGHNIHECDVIISLVFAWKVIVCDRLGYNVPKVIIYLVFALR